MRRYRAVFARYRLSLVTLAIFTGLITGAITSEAQGISRSSVSATVQAAGPQATIPGGSTGVGNWFWQNPLPQGNTLLGISCVTATTTCYAVGRAGTLISSTDSGATWATSRSGTANDLISISCPDAVTCYAAGASGTILYTNNGGTSWIAQTSGTTVQLNGISCPTLTTCFAVGNSSTILFTTNSGATWVSQAAGATADLNGISCPAGTTACYAVGFTTASISSRIFSATNAVSGGWTSSTALGFLRRLGAISCVDASNCIAVGFNSDFSGVALKILNGVAQTMQDPGTADPLLSISCLSLNNCVAVGGWLNAAGLPNRPESNFLRVTNDGGSSWSNAETAPSPVATAGIGVSCLSGTNLACVAVGKDAIILTRPAGAPGVSWTYRTLGPFNIWQGVYCPTLLICYAVGQGGSVLFTSNGGATWTAQNSTVSAIQLQSVSCKLADTCNIVGDGGTILYTSNSGGMWFSSNAGAPNLNSISCPVKPSPVTKNCFAVGDTGRILVISGISFIPQTSPISNNLNAVSCNTIIDCIAVGDSGVVLVTTDGGTNWLNRTSASATTQNLAGITCVTSQLCYATGANGTIIKTTNGGTNWSVQTTPAVVATFILEAISCPSALNCYAVDNNGSTLATFNGGTTWTYYASGATNPLYGLSCPLGCITVGDDGAVLTNQYLVTASNSGPSTTPGTLAYALSRAVTGQAITLNVSGNSINVNSVLAPLEVGVNFGGGSCANPTTLTTNGNTLTIKGKSIVQALTLQSRNQKTDLKANGNGNTLRCVKALP